MAASSLSHTSRDPAPARPAPLTMPMSMPMPMPPPPPPPATWARGTAGEPQPTDDELPQPQAPARGDARRGRLRIRRACEPCRSRKRKCDGAAPCGECVQYEYECTFAGRGSGQPQQQSPQHHAPARRQQQQHHGHLRLRLPDDQHPHPHQLRHQQPPPRHARAPPTPSTPSSAVARAASSADTRDPDAQRDDDSRRSHILANSSITFPRTVERALRPTARPSLRRGFGFNLGIGIGPAPAPVPDAGLTALLTAAEMADLVAVYVARVHPIYGFLDPDALDRRVERRWAAAAADDDDDVWDPVLCGVAVLGSLFGGALDAARRAQLAALARAALDASAEARPPTIVDAASWTLRALMLRICTTHHAAWMASCAAVQVLEATGALENPGPASASSPRPSSSRPSRSPARPNDADDDDDDALAREDAGLGPGGRERLIWVAVLLNVWISNECGRSFVSLRGVSRDPPHDGPRDHTSQIVRLFQLSLVLDPDRTPSLADWDATLAAIEAEGPSLSHDALFLSQSNLTFAIYRRMRLTSPRPLASEVLRRVVRLGMSGVDAAVRLADAGCPWWHVANVPFQLLCVLLAMDQEHALAHLAPVLTAIRAIAARFTASTNMQRAVVTAETLVCLARAKKERELANLAVSLAELPTDRRPPDLQHHGTNGEARSETNGESNASAGAGAGAPAAPPHEALTSDSDFLDWNWDWDSLFDMSSTTAFPIF